MNMAEDRGSSWLNEIGKAPPRKPSISGPLLPFSIPVGSAPKAYRSQSYSVGQPDPRAAFRFNSGTDRFATEDAIAETSIVPPSHHSRSRAQTSHGLPPPSISRNLSTGLFIEPYSNGGLSDEYTPSTPFAESRRRSINPTKSYGANSAQDFDVSCSFPTRANNPYLRDSPRARHDFDAKSRRSVSDGLYCVVQFKNYRAEVYEFPPGFGLDLQVDQMVLVEADRGSDLGVVVAVNQSLAEAIQRKVVANQQHTRELLQYSSRAMSHAHMNPAAFNLNENSNHNNPTAGPIYNTGSHFPKAVRRLALDHEIIKFKEKSQAEEIAREMCQQKADKHGLRMEVLDAEYQIDSNKLTFYYYANHVIIFSELVAELFKAFKTRIWMAPVNSDAVPTSPITIRLPQPSPSSLRVPRTSPPLPAYLAPFAEPASTFSRSSDSYNYPWQSYTRSGRNPVDDMLANKMRVSLGISNAETAQDPPAAANRPNSSRSSNSTFGGLGVSTIGNSSIWNNYAPNTTTTGRDHSLGSSNGYSGARMNESVGAIGGQRSESSDSRGLASSASWEMVSTTSE